MGDFADDIIDRCFDEDMFDGVFRRTRYINKFQDDTDEYEWKDGSGDIHKMVEMNIPHIKNCIRFLEDKFPDHPKLPLFREVLKDKELDLMNSDKGD